MNSPRQPRQVRVTLNGPNGRTRMLRELCLLSLILTVPFLAAAPAAASPSAESAATEDADATSTDCIYVDTTTTPPRVIFVRDC